MKITDADVIKNGERELIDAITGDLDWNTIEQLFKEKHKLSIKDDVEYKKGDIIVVNNQIAYKLDFEVTVSLSILFDRDGQYISLCSGDENISAQSDSNSESGLATASSGEADESTETDIEFSSSNPVPASTPEKDPRENISQMASQIADMITEINEE